MEPENETAICSRCFDPVPLATAEYREVPAPTRREPDRILTERLHPSCAEMSDRLVEMGRRLGPVGEMASQAGMA